MRRLVLLCLLLILPGAAAGARQPTTTFAAAGDRAVTTMLHVFYAGHGLWNACDNPICGRSNVDWGVDSLTYTLALRWTAKHDPRIATTLKELLATAPTYPAPCQAKPCGWSDVPAWDSIAASREYEILHDPSALAKAEAAFAYVEDGKLFALGACPQIRYQQPNGEANHLKTLETDANAIKAALLLYRATHSAGYLDSAVRHYSAVRSLFLDPNVPLYSVYVFDDGKTCTQVPHRFFASVNGDMIWNGLELSRATGDQRYRNDALATAKAVDHYLSDPAGVFADLQAENDIVEPLVEAMYGLATQAHASFARSWILRNAASAISALVPKKDRQRPTIIIQTRNLEMPFSRQSFGSQL